MVMQLGALLLVKASRVSVPQADRIMVFALKIKLIPFPET